MKRILVPTDFSACAADSLNAAVSLAAQWDAEIHLLHVLDGGFAAASEREKTQLVNNAQLLLQKLNESHPGARIHTRWDAGKLALIIEKQAGELDCDLIVMGSHGASGRSDFFIGSNTQRVLRVVHRPVLVIKEALETLRFAKVVYASDFRPSDLKPFQFFVNWIRPFQPELHLVQVHTSSLLSAPYVVTKAAMEDFRQHAGELISKTHVYRDLSVDQGVRSIAREIGADLIALSNHERSPIRRMLVGSNVEALVNHAHVPVLSIDYPQAPDKQDA